MILITIDYVAHFSRNIYQKFNFHISTALQEVLSLA